MAYTSVKISANSSDYQTQMKSAAAQMKNLSSEYSVAATKAKLFGSAADSLKAKAESLTQKIKVQENIVKMNGEQHERLTKQLTDQKTKQEELKSKLEATKKAYEAEKKATGENSDATKVLKEELDKLEKEFKENESAIGKTETALDNQTAKTNQSKVKLMEMEAELKNVNKELKNHKLNEFADGCDKAGKKIEGFGKKMSVVSAGIAGIAAASIKSFSEMKEGYDIIVTKTGATGDALDDLKASANNVFGEMPEDMAKVGEAVGEVNTRFHSTGTELEETSKLFIQFASINDTQVTQSVDQVDKIMQAWNIDVSQTGNLLGLLTQKAQDTGISVDTLESYVLDNNAAFKEMGLSLPQAIDLMAQFDANGVDTTQALAGLKKALQNATAEGKSMDVALEETIGSIKDAKTDTEALQIATELFGKKGAAEMATAIRENRIDLTSLSASMSEYGSVVETTYNNTKSPMDEAKVAMNNIKLALSDMGNTMLSSAAPAISELTSKIKEVTQWFTSLDEGQQQTIIKIGLFTAAVGPAAVGIGKFAQGISSTVKTGQQFVSGVSSIIAKITAKTAATAAGTAADAAGTAATAAHTAATTAATATTGAMTVAQGALNTVMNLCPIILIVSLIVGLIAAGVALYKNWDKVKEKLSELWGHIKEKFDAIKEKITGVFKGVKEIASKLTSAATETVKQNLNNMKTAYEENGGGVKGIVAAGWEGIKGIYTFGFDFIDNLTGGKLSEIKNKFLNSEVGQAASKVFDGIRSTASTVMTSTVDTVKEKLNNMKTAYEENGGGIKGIVAAGWEGIEGYYTAGFTFVDNLTGGKLTEVKNKFLEKTSEIKADWSEKFTNIKDTATNLMEASRQNVSEKLNNMKTAYEENGGGIKGIVAASFTGVRDTIGTLMSAANTLTGGKLDSIRESFRSKLESAHSTVSSVMEKIRSKFNEKMETAKNTVSSAINKIRGFFNFSWSLPHIKMPHFGISGSFSLDPPSIPHFSVEWYKTGAIMNREMIFGMSGNRLLAGGEPETGGEAILPLAPFYTKLNDMLDKKLSTIQPMQNVYVENHTYIDGDEISSRTVSKVDTKMVNNKRKGR